MVDWFHQCRETAGEALEYEPVLIGTEVRPIQVDEAKLAGSTNYRKGRRLQGDLSNFTNDSIELCEPEDDDEGDPDDSKHVSFGEDHKNWAWVVGLWSGKGNVSFVRVPNRTSRTLIAVLNKYCAPESVLHTDGWKGYSALSSHGYTHKTVIHKYNYVDTITGAHTQGVERQWVEVRVSAVDREAIVCCYNHT